MGRGLLEKGCLMRTRTAPGLPPFGLALVVIAAMVSAPVATVAMQPVPWRPTTYTAVLEPAELEFPPEIQVIAVLSRYRPGSTAGKLVKNVEGVFTKEWIGMDKKGVKAAVDSIVAALDESPRFQVLDPGLDLPGTGTEFLPTPLPAHEIRQLCEAYGADALVAIEAFDSGHDTDSEEKKTGLFKLKKKKVYEMEAKVIFGWRLYDGRTGYLLDTLEGDDEATFEEEETEHLPSATSVVKEFGTKAGWTYAQRISPTVSHIPLSYFGKGSEQIKQGKALAKKMDWEGAEAVWRQELENSDLEVRARAAHNIAVAYDVRGDPEEALVWATLASHEYGNKVAWEYYEELAPRVERLREANEQLAAAAGSAVPEATDPATRLAAKVAEVSEGTVYLNVGEAVGVRSGELFEIYAAAKEILDPDSGVSLGHVDTVIGVVEVTKVINERLSEASLVEGDGIQAGQRAVRLKASSDLDRDEQH